MRLCTARRQGLHHFQHAGLRPRTARGCPGPGGHCRSRRRRDDRAGRRHSATGAPDRARPGNPRQHADERHQRRRRASCAELRRPRVTLARELSLEEVRAIREATDCELEIFVHGALCVAYSGQCFSSEAWGGRSANRGQCAQACRLPYEMMVDGQRAAARRRAISAFPRRSVRAEQVPEIVDIGISALKIEGRYKDADYVALDYAAYRQAVDEAWAGRKLARPRRRTAAGAGVFARARARSSSPARIIRPWWKAVLRGIAAC